LSGTTTCVQVVVFCFVWVERDQRARISFHNMTSVEEITLSVEEKSISVEEVLISAF